jgi:hypothetical protein
MRTTPGMKQILDLNDLKIFKYFISTISQPRSTISNMNVSQKSSQWSKKAPAKQKKFPTEQKFPKLSISTSLSHF